MPRIITAVFADGNYKAVIGAWQWDYGSVLHIQGLKLDPAVEIHFSLDERGGESDPRIGITKDGVTEVVIPDSMLGYETAQDYNIYAFVYIRDADSGRTEYKIRIGVKARPKPKAFEKTEDSELFQKAIEAVNESSVASSASAKSAESWAHGHEDYPERAEDNAAYYANQAKEIVSGLPEKVETWEKSIENKAQEYATSVDTDIQSVNDAGATQVNSINSIGSANKKMVENAGQEVLNKFEDLKNEIFATDEEANDILFGGDSV